MKRDKDYHFRKACFTNCTYQLKMYRNLRNSTNNKEKNLRSKYFCWMVEDAKGVSYETWRATKQVLPGDKNRLFFFCQSLKMGSGTLKISLSPDHKPVLCVNWESIGKTISTHFDCF